MGVFARAKARNAIDLNGVGQSAPASKRKDADVRARSLRQPDRDRQHGSESIDLAVFHDDLDLVEPQRGIYRMEPGASDGYHKTS